MTLTDLRATSASQRYKPEKIFGPGTTSVEAVVEIVWLHFVVKLATSFKGAGRLSWKRTALVKLSPHPPRQEPRASGYLLWFLVYIL
jgi:hypothetical protein